jgi:UDP-2,4-diacetamido-2,4,6-trideoxy-beta-L-altropyranose hydrolase
MINKAVAFRLDASRELGSGHAYRCVTLALELRKHGWVSTFYLNEGCETTAPVFAKNGFSTRSAETFLTDVTSSISQYAFAVIDNYEIGNSIHSQVRQAAVPLLVIEDLANRNIECDILLDQTFGRSWEDYSTKCNGDALPLLGSKFALLRAEFAAARKEVQSKVYPGGNPKTVFVNFGGTDNQSHTLNAVAAIVECGLGGDVVVGAMAKNFNEIEALVGQQANIRLHRQTNQMAKIMSQCDFAICAGGTSSWERCCLGLPTIQVATAENQNTLTQNLEHAGAIIHVSNPTVDIFVREIRFLQSNIDQLLDMRARAFEICDGMGAARVSEAIENTWRGAKWPKTQRW